MDSPWWGVSSPPLSLAGLPLSSPGVSPRAPPMLWPAPPWSEVSPPHSALSTWRAPSRSPGVPRAETEDKRQIRGSKKAFCDRQRKDKKKYLFQFEHLLFVLVVGGLALAEQNLPLLLQPADLLLEAALLLVQVPDGRLVGHLGCLQGADLTWKQSNWNHVCVLKRLYNQESELTFKLDGCYCYCCLNKEVASAAELLNRKSAVC